MSQQYPVFDGNKETNNIHRNRALFVETGFGFIEMANNKGKRIEDGVEIKIGRIVEEYTPPTPTFRAAEIKIANAPSRIHATGKSSYKIGLRIIFPDKLTYTDFMCYAGNSLKYYDERGGIYNCAVDGQPDVQMIEAGKRYDVNLNLVGIRKETDETLEDPQYIDISAGYVTHTITVTQKMYRTGYIHVSVPGIEKEFDAYVSDVYDDLETAALYFYYSLLANGLTKYFSVSRIGNVIKLTAKDENYSGTFTIDPGETGMKFTVATGGGKHWAYNDIMECARAGIIAERDNNGNFIYVFRPIALATRAEVMTMLNNTRKWIERVLRG